MSRYPSLEFVRLCCVTCKRERVIVAFWAAGDWCNHGATCAWGDGYSHPAHDHGSLSLELVQ